MTRGCLDQSRVSVRLTYTQDDRGAYRRRGLMICLRLANAVASDLLNETWRTFRDGFQEIIPHLQAK
jgi:hypothetical protein